jgi:hypothetical protein
MAITKRITKGSSLTYQEMDDNLEAIAPRTSSTGSLQIPTGTTAQRDSSPSDGFLRYNTQLNTFEGYINGSWGDVRGSGGGGGDVNQNAFSTFAVSGQTDIVADLATDTINFAAGSNITLTTNATTDTLTIAATFSQDFAFSSLTGTPTTVAGYGITDAQALLVSGTNIKTVNSQSILGSGNLTVTATADWTTLTNKPTTIAGFGITDAFDGAFSSLTGKPTTVSGYGITDAQAILVSGTNIKTINGASVLGSGDLTVTGSYGDSDVSSHLNTNSANSNEYLRWNGSDFEWASLGGGGGSETDPVVGAIDGIVKADGSGNISQAVAGVDYSEFDGNWSSLQNVPTDLTTAGFSNASLLELVDVVNGAGANGQVLTSNGSAFSFQDVGGGGGGGGATSFLGLSDTPANYVGAGNQLVAVNNQSSGLTFIAQSAGAESNDLSQTVTWAIVPDAFISNTSVVQHQADLRITESQITDLQNYIVNETDPIFTASAVGNVAISVTEGFLKNVGGEWFYDTNTYVTSSGAETDPIFSAHTTSDIIQGTGFLVNGGSANTWYYDANTYIQGSDVPDNETDPVFTAWTGSSISDGQGFLVNDGSGNWYYDSNSYITAAGSETDPVFTAHTTYNIVNGTGYLKNDGGGTWSYESNTFLTVEEDPIFEAHTVSAIVDGEGFLRQDVNNNWYWDANTYITANDIPAATVTLDDVLTNGSSSSQSAEFGGLTVGGTTVALVGANTSTLINDSGFITLTDLSATGDLTYDNTTGEFTANLQSTGITLSDLSANNEVTPSGNGSLSYDNSTGVFTYTPPDLSGLGGGGGTETDPIFIASAVGNVVASSSDAFLRNNGGEWYYDTNTYVTSAPSDLSGLSDVTVTSPADNEILVYDNGSSVFVNSTVDTLVDAHLNTSSASNNDVLSYDASIGDYVWTTSGSGGGIAYSDLSVTSAAAGSASLSYDDTSGVFTYTPPDLSSYLTAESDTFATVTGRGSSSASTITANGNINVVGTISDGGRIILNSAQSGSPSSSSTNYSYIQVNRGVSPDVAIRWHEGLDRWEFTNDGSNFFAFPTTATAATLDAVLTAGDESDLPLTLFRDVSGNVNNGSLVFENRDLSPNINSSVGDIRFFGDGIDEGGSTLTLLEYGRISVKPSLISTSATAGSRGFIDFQAHTSNGLESLLVVGVDPYDPNSPVNSRIGTQVKGEFYAGPSMYIIDEVDTANDIYSDTNISLNFVGYDLTTNSSATRAQMYFQNNMLRTLAYDMNAATPYNTYTQLTQRPISAGGLSYTSVIGGTAVTYDVYTDQNADNKVRTIVTDDQNLLRFGAYANTEYITERSDFGGFNGGSGGGADLVPGNEIFGALAFFVFGDANNGSAGQNRYIPAGHTEEAVHGMGILRDSGQHSLQAPRWDPFGGPDFRVSLDSSSSDANYFFGSTSTSNTPHPTNLIITNSDYTPPDGDVIGRIKFKGGEDTFTQYEEYALITVTMQDTAAGAYDARMAMYVKGNGGTGDNANIGLTLDGNSSIIRSRANHHYFGAFNTTTVDSETVPTTNYVKVIADDDDTRQVIQSSGEMYFTAGLHTNFGNYKFSGYGADYRFENDTTNNSASPTLIIADVNTAQNANNDVVGTIDFQRGTSSRARISAKNVSTDGANIEGSLRFQVTSTTATPDYPDMILDGTTGLSINDGLGLTVDGVTTLKTTTEVTSALTGATGTVAHDLSTGAIFDHTSLAADFTANFTNVPTTVSRTIGVVLILTQGGTAYMPTAVQIDGAAQTILWQGGSAPSGTASGTDIVSFTLIRSSGGAWKVIGSAQSYS